MELRIRILNYSGSSVQTGYIASIAVSATLNGVAPFTKHPTTFIPYGQYTQYWNIRNGEVFPVL